jgi:hypothetical protein
VNGYIRVRNGTLQTFLSVFCRAQAGCSIEHLSGIAGVSERARKFSDNFGHCNCVILRDSRKAPILDGRS